MTMTEDSKPNFSKAYNYANEILTKSIIISKFPFSAKQFVLEISNNTQCISFEKAHRSNVDVEAYGSKSASVIKDDENKYIIFYNQDEMPERVKFSILHEFRTCVSRT